MVHTDHLAHTLESTHHDRTRSAIPRSTTPCPPATQTPHPPPPPLRTITDKRSLDLLVAQCNTDNIPTVLHVHNSAVPRCQSFLAVYERFATANASKDGIAIQYAKMDYTSETSAMFKFAPNQLPVTVVMVGRGWARTVTGADIGGIGARVAEVVRVRRDGAGG